MGTAFEIPPDSISNKTERRLKATPHESLTGRTHSRSVFRPSRLLHFHLAKDPSHKAQKHARPRSSDGFVPRTCEQLEDGLNRARVRCDSIHGDKDGVCACSL